MHALNHRGPSAAPNLAESLRPPIVPVDACGQRFDCRLLTRGAVPPALPGGFSASSHALRLLDESTGFAEALSGIYGVDLTVGFTALAVVEGIAADPRFLHDADHRHDAMEALGNCSLPDEGLIVARPAPGVWRRLARGVSATCPDAPVMALCELLGATGFAQLCDPTLDAPVPLFVRPWRRGSGALQPVRLPQEPFSSTLRVVRLEGRRMVLLDRRSIGSPVRLL
jgi:hypothetical protein